MRKNNKRAERHRRNKKVDRNHKREAWNSGKIIYENYSQSMYFSPSFTCALCDRLYNILIPQDSDTQRSYYVKVRAYRINIRDLLVLWSPKVKENREYRKLKGLIETYWDCPENLLQYGRTGYLDKNS